MTTPVRMTTAVTLVLVSFLEDPDTPRHGLDLMASSGHTSGTLYPILVRLRRAGLVEADWERDVPENRLARRHYRLTADGTIVAESA
jgi:PadR family transcriptional regulator, regulatory protein PadR